MDEEQKIYNKPVKTRQRVVMATVFIVVALMVACVVMCLPLLIDKAAKEAIIKIPKTPRDRWCQTRLQSTSTMTMPKK